MRFVASDVSATSHEDTFAPLNVDKNAPKVGGAWLSNRAVVSNEKPIYCRLTGLFFIINPTRPKTQDIGLNKAIDESRLRPRRHLASHDE